MPSDEVFERREGREGREKMERQQRKMEERRERVEERRRNAKPAIFTKDDLVDRRTELLKRVLGWSVVTVLMGLAWYFGVRWIVN